MNNNFVVIMAGGVGTRFWPFSRNNYPKQFHDVLGTGQSLLQQTVARYDGVVPPENVYIVTSQEYYGLTKSQLPQLTDDQILLEPARRNTAPCIAYACYKIAARNPNANIVVAPADHIILKEDLFKQKIVTALHATATQDILVTLGILPTRPDTGYGYIHFDHADTADVKRVKEFKEKPALETAQTYLASGQYVWNAGIFVWNVRAILRAFEAFMPATAALFAAGSTHFYEDTEAAFIAQMYGNCGSESIDFGILEKADNVFVVLSDIGWSDLGTWKSLYEASDKDENLNVTDGLVHLRDTRGCIVKTPKDKLVVINGLEDFIVAENENVLLICRRDDEQLVKEFVGVAKAIHERFV